MFTKNPAISLDHFVTFGDMLKYLRRRSGLTQRELSIAVGYSDSMISRLEQNQRLPDLSTIKARFVPALGVEDEPDFVRRLLELAATVRREDAPGPGSPPYKGLLHFDEIDSDLFFGREALTAKLLARVKALVGKPDVTRFLAIVGASGSGKSSLVRAGLVPALHWQVESTAWPILLLTPTAHPLEALAASLTGEMKSAAAKMALADELAQDTSTLYRVLQRETDRLGVAHTLVVVDQFEELFTLCRREIERQAFVDNLMLAVGFHSFDRTPRAEQGAAEGWSGERNGERGGAAIGVIALRADFYAHCADYLQLREALSHHQEYIGAMSGEELGRAIDGPAKRGAWELEPGLVEVLLQELQGEPGALPLLSHALLETWERRRGRTLTLSGYAASGGVRGAIAETAEAVFQDQLNPHQRELARRIFLRLTEIGEDETLPDTRRRVGLSELTSNLEEGAAVREVLTQLADARLITTEQETVEVAHEALIREWPTLREWLAENREGLRLHRRLTEAAQEWERARRNDGELYHGARLAHALEWAASNASALNQLEREFLEASRAWTEHEAAEREVQRQRELAAARKLAETEKARAEEQKHSANRLRLRNRLTAGAGVIALLLAVLAVLFGFQSGQNATRAETNLAVAQANAATAEAERQRAESEKQLAISRELAIASVSNLEKDPELSILLALHGLSVAHTSEVESALHRAVQASRVQLSIPGNFKAIDYSPDGKLLALGGSDGTVTVVDTANGQGLLSFAAYSNSVSSLTYSPDGKRIAVAGRDNTAKVWDAATGQELINFVGHTDEVVSIAFSPDGARIVTGSSDTTVKVWDALSGQELLTLSDHTTSVISAAFSPDGKWLITKSDGPTVKVRDAETGQVLPIPQEDLSHDIVFSPDGTRYANIAQPLLKMWDFASGQELFTLTLDEVYFFDFSADGKRMVTAGQQRGSIRIWDAVTADELLVTFNPGGSFFVHFSPDGEHIAAADHDYTVRVFDTSPAGSREWLTLEAHSGGVRRTVYSPNGTRLATAGIDGTAKVFDANTGKDYLTLSGHDESVFGIAYSPDGKRLATASFDKTVKVWDAKTGQELLTLSKMGHGDGIVGNLYSGVLDIAFSPDGTRLASAGADGTAIVWDAITGQELLTLSNHGVGLTNLAFSPDGRRLLTASDTDLTLGIPESGFADAQATMWDLATGHEIFSVTGPVRIWGLAFDKDGRRFATGGFDGVLRLWDAASGHKLLELPGHGGTIGDIHFSSDGKTVATGSADGTAKVWDAVMGTELATLTGHTLGIFGVALSPDGTRLATASRDGTVRVHALQLEDLIELAKARVTRSFTLDECQQYLHVETCP
jgi:WD40 repeat protein/DNA-binding XRE family transcriptional regulator